jgi:hypothetical protein
MSRLTRDYNRDQRSSERKQQIYQRGPTIIPVASIMTMIIIAKLYNDKMDLISTNLVRARYSNCTSQSRMAALDDQTSCCFLDLSREIRDEIYILAVLVPMQKQSVYTFSTDADFRCMSYPHFVSLPLLFLAAECRARSARHPALSQVNRQIRSKVDEVFLGLNQWKLEVNSYTWTRKNDVPENVDLAVRMKVLERRLHDIEGPYRLRHLRDVTLELGFASGKCVVCIQVHHQRGLMAERPSHPKNYGLDVQEHVLGWHLAVTEMKRQENGWMGEAIVEFIVGGRELWKEFQLAHEFEDGIERSLVSD